MTSHPYIVVTTMEITSVEVKPQQPMAVIRVNLTELGDLEKLATEAEAVGIRRLDLFARLCNLSDLDTAILNMGIAAELTDDGHWQKPPRLRNLADAHKTRFDLLGDMPDIDSAISNMDRAVELTDDRHWQK